MDDNETCDNCGFPLSAGTYNTFFCCEVCFNEFTNGLFNEEEPDEDCE